MIHIFEKYQNSKINSIRTLNMTEPIAMQTQDFDESNSGNLHRTFKSIHALPKKLSCL